MSHVSVKCLSKCDVNTREYSDWQRAIFKACCRYMDETHSEKFIFQVSCTANDSRENTDNFSQNIKNKEENDSVDFEWCKRTGVIPVLLVDHEKKENKRQDQYIAQEPFYNFERLVIPQTLRDSLSHAINLFQYHDLIYNTWGLKANSPFPVVALNFWGPPGTGKTLAAHAIASKLKRKVILASYAQIESMYHGEGPKNVEAIFKAAEEQNALLFIDEADSLLSRRLTDVKQGSENAINSMRSQILICLEKFNGIVIFATNLVIITTKHLKAV